MHNFCYKLFSLLKCSSCRPPIHCKMIFRLRHLSARIRDLNVRPRSDGFRFASLHPSVLPPIVRRGNMSSVVFTQFFGGGTGDLGLVPVRESARGAHCVMRVYTALLLKISVQLAAILKLRFSTYGLDMPMSQLAPTPPCLESFPRLPEEGSRCMQFIGAWPGYNSTTCAVISKMVLQDPCRSFSQACY